MKKKNDGSVGRTRRSTPSRTVLKRVLVMLLGITSTFFVHPPTAVDGQPADSDASQSPSQSPGDCAICNAAGDGSPSTFQSHVPGHRFDCATCHHPHPVAGAQPFAVDVRSKCQECHPQAWTESVFHRLPAEDFINCNSCHVPHVWRANGNDCLSCHDNLTTPAGTVPVQGFGSITQFAHERHAHLQCSLCHDSREKHADLKMTNVTTCMQCHHTGEVVQDCSTCHAASMLAGGLQVPVSFRVIENRFQRDLAFDHSAHATVACDVCHEQGLAQTPHSRCTDCHHTRQDNCVNCHLPSAPGSHTRAAHEQKCADCHRPQTFEPLMQARNACTVCHQDFVDHYTQKSCTTCHKLSPHGTEALWQP